MKGKTVVITGGNAGIGKATAIALAKKGAEVVITSRSEEKAKATINEIKSASGNKNVSFVLVDLSSQKSVRKAAEELKTKCPKIDVLINNAGCYVSELQLSSDGLEMQFGTNHIGHFLLTNLILDKVKAAEKARIINLSSIAHKSTRELNFGELNYEKEESIGKYCIQKH